MHSMRRLGALTYVQFGSHKDIREMEHELFRSKLKSLVDHAVFSDIVKSSSSGEQPHCSKAMQLVLLGSVQDRRKRVGVAVNDTPQLDPMPQVQKSSEMQKELTQGGRSNFGPTPALQQPPSPNSSSASAPTMEEAPPDPTPPSESLGKTVALVEYGIPFASGGDSSPGDAVRLVCSNCGGKPIYTQSCWGLRCFSCPNITSPWHTMKCAGCGTIRAGLVSTCSC